MDGGEDILTDYTFGDHNRILEVVPFPRHEGDLHIATQGEFTLFGSISLAEYLPLMHTVTLAHDRF